MRGRDEEELEELPRDGHKEAMRGGSNRIRAAYRRKMRTVGSLEASRLQPHGKPPWWFFMIFWGI